MSAGEQSNQTVWKYFGQSTEVHNAQLGFVMYQTCQPSQMSSRDSLAGLMDKRKSRQAMS